MDRQSWQRSKCTRHQAIRCSILHRRQVLILWDRKSCLHTLLGLACLRTGLGLKQMWSIGLFLSQGNSWSWHNLRTFYQHLQRIRPALHQRWRTSRLEWLARELMSGSILEFRCRYLDQSTRWWWGRRTRCCWTAAHCSSHRRHRSCLQQRRLSVLLFLLVHCWLERFPPRLLPSSRSSRDPWERFCCSWDHHVLRKGKPYRWEWWLQCLLLVMVHRWYWRGSLCCPYHFRHVSTQSPLGWRTKCHWVWSLDHDVLRRWTPWCCSSMGEHNVVILAMDGRLR